MRIASFILLVLVAGCGEPTAKNSANNTNNENNENNTNANNANNTDPPRQPLVHRAKPVACDNDRPAGVDYTEMGEGFGSCTSDADCTEGDNGRCLDDRGTSCTYDECFADEDCPGGSVCECEGGFHADSNACLAGNCVTDADCGDNYCSPSLGDCGDYAGYVGYFCHTTDDECIDDADCAAQGGGYCAYDQGVGHWLCSTAQCVG